MQVLEVAPDADLVGAGRELAELGGPLLRRRQRARVGREHPGRAGQHGQRQLQRAAARGHGRAAQLHDPGGVPLHDLAGQGRLRGGRGAGRVRRRQDQAGGGVQEGQRREQGVI